MSYTDRMAVHEAHVVAEQVGNAIIATWEGQHAGRAAQARDLTRRRNELPDALDPEFFAKHLTLYDENIIRRPHYAP